ncbi:MAG: hypothetical protein A2539_02770 [Elusimicrobia bacterium RIFOXYD2_FULL_34_15]|nr:MAG: hypothetical protein A2539_02770 [Elusimicrobia bacterium RIFOXYD2_FULL_34_15]
MIKKIFLVSYIILGFYQLSFSETKTAKQYYISANKSFNNHDLTGAYNDIIKAKELKKDDQNINVLVKAIAKAYFNRGGEKYNEGQLFNAIDDFDTSLKLYEDKTVKDVFGLCLTEVVGQIYSENKSYEKAVPYIQKLIKLFPEELEYRQMYESANANRSVAQNVESLPGVTSQPETVQAPKAQTSQTSQASQPQTAQTQQVFQSPQTEQVPPITQTSQPPQVQAQVQAPQIEKLFSLIEARLQKNEKLLKNYDQKQRDLIQKIYSNSETKRAKLLKEMITSVVQKENTKSEKVLKETVNSAMHKESVGMKKALFFTTTLGIVAMGAILALLVYILTRYIKKRSAVILWHGEVGMAESLKEKAQELLVAKKKALQLTSEIDNLKIIEAEIVEKTDPDAAENILSSFLNSTNSLTKSLAAKALFKHNPEKSLDILEDMLERGNEQSKIDSLTTLGEIGSAEAIKVLIDGLGKLQYSEKKVAIRSLVRISNEEKEKIPPYLLDKIENVLSDLKEREGWLLE